MCVCVELEEERRIPVFYSEWAEEEIKTQPPAPLAQPVISILYTLKTWGWPEIVEKNQST